MVQESPKTGVEQEEFRVYEACLKEAVGTSWWNEFVRIVRNRRQRFMETLATSENSDQRHDDRIRGQISEANFVLALDAYAQATFAKKGGSK